MKKIFLLVAALVTCNAYAQTPKVSFRARALMDASVTDYRLEQNIETLYSMEDLRLGFKALYGDMEFKADLGFGRSKVAIKDLLFNYHLPNGMISVGNTYAPFSMEMLISTLDMYQHQAATASAAFGDSRKMGVSYTLDLPRTYLAGGVYTDNDINVKDADRSDAYVATARALLRTSNNEGGVFHIGGAYSYKTSQSEENGTLPTGHISASGVTNMLGESVLQVDIAEQGASSKVCAEILLQRTKWRIQGEYHLNWIESGSNTYAPKGGYVQGSYLLRGKGFNYDTMYAVASRPSSARALELNFRFNATDLNDTSAQILGGAEQDYSIGLNYYLNKNFAVKLNCSYMDIGNNCNSFYRKDLVIGQIRLQYVL